MAFLSREPRFSGACTGLPRKRAIKSKPLKSKVSFLHRDWLIREAKPAPDAGLA